MTTDPALGTLTLQRDSHVLLIGLNRPEKRNAFDVAMLTDLSLAYGLLESDDDLRVAVDRMTRVALATVTSSH